MTTWVAKCSSDKYSCRMTTWETCHEQSRGAHGDLRDAEFHLHEAIRMRSNRLAAIDVKPGNLPWLLYAVRDAAAARDVADRALSAIVAEARADGLSWGQIADALGISRQGARQRYGATSVPSVPPQTDTLEGL